MELTVRDIGWIEQVLGQQLEAWQSTDHANVATDEGILTFLSSLRIDHYFWQDVAGWVKEADLEELNLLAVRDALPLFPVAEEETLASYIKTLELDLSFAKLLMWGRDLEETRPTAVAQAFAEPTADQTARSLEAALTQEEAFRESLREIMPDEPTAREYAGLLVGLSLLARIRGNPDMMCQPVPLCKGIYSTNP